MSDGIDEPVHVQEWCPVWFEDADAVVAECRTVLGDEALAVEHFGSTAVRGLAAKPVLDVLVGVAAGRRHVAARRLAAAGWEHLGEAGVPGREHLRRRQGQHANVHVVERDSALFRDGLLLRDHLRHDAAARERYASVKRRAAQEAPTLLAYSARKASVVSTLLEEARKRPRTDQP